MQRLALTCEIADRETPTSYASRLAVRNMVSGASEFCLDMGLSWKVLSMGDAQEIRRLADLAGAPPALLQRYAIRSIGPARHRIGSELATNRSIQRMGTAHCPLCIRESVAETGFSGAYRRVDWQFLSVRCCEIHRTPLVTLPAEKFATHAYDFASVTRKHWETVVASAESAVSREPTDLETYIRKRLTRWQGNEWIDSLPLPVLSKASEMLGMRMRFGASAVSSQMSDEQWHACGQTGFEVLREGPSGLRTVLQGFKAEYRSPFASHNRDFGSFFLWLTRENSASGLETLRKVVRQFIDDNYPVVAGSVILGRKVDRPTCVTLGSVEKQLGIRQERLVHMLAQVDPTSCDLSNPPTHLTRPQIQMLEQRIHDIVPLQNAVEFMGCTVYYATEFVKKGMLAKSRDAADRTYLSKADLSAFIAPVTALQLADPDHHLLPIRAVSKQLRRSVTEIYKSFLDNQFSQACRNPAKHGIDSLLLDPREVLLALKKPTPTPDLGLDEVRQYLQINHAALQLLGKAGHLPTYKTHHHASGYPRKYIKKCHVEKFDEAFISLSKLRREIGKDSHGGLLKKLAAKRINPKFIGERVTRIYLKSDLQVMMPDLISLKPTAT